MDSWVSSFVSSLTNIIQEYNLDGINIDYKCFSADLETFIECIGRLIITLKYNGVISFALIAPFDYDQGPVLINLLVILRLKTKNYEGGNVLASSSTDGSGGLLPENEFFTARNWLKSWNKLHGIFVWSADDSKARGFPYEKQSPALLAISH
ncbi:hypothetical protein LguiB_000916 [Lonicera macranthoides]